MVPHRRLLPVRGGLWIWDTVRVGLLHWGLHHQCVGLAVVLGGGGSDGCLVGSWLGSCRLLPVRVQHSLLHV